MTAPANASPTPAPAPSAAPVQLSVAMNAPVFPYGAQQSFSVGGFTCPTGYSSFQTPLTGSTEYGCRKNGASPLGLTAVTGLLGVAPKSNGNGFLGATGVPLAAVPTITNVQFVDAGPGSAWRPSSDVFYAGEDFQVNVVGSVQNNGGYDPTPCGYKVDVQSVSSGKVISSLPFTAFNIDDLGAIASPGAYNIIVKPYAPPNSTTPTCLGKAERTVNLLYETAWVNRPELVRVRLSLFSVP